MIRSAPVSSAAYGVPQALAWNIGTIERARSYSERASAAPEQTAMAWRMVDRWL